jgi:XapX domain-containing protein
MKLTIGVVIAFAIGAACRYWQLPAPAPPTLFGALLVAAMSFGYQGTDWMMAKKASPTTVAQSQPADIRKQ